MTTHAEFGAKTEAAEVANVFGTNIRGKTVLITGVSPNGLGSATALAIASKGPALIIMTARDPSKVNAVISQISDTYPMVPTRALAIDLSSLASVRHAAQEVLAHDEPSIDVLINNAGVMNIPTRKLSPDGIEMQLATNHVGHFLFTNLIMPKLLAAGNDARIVVVASAGHMMSPFRFSDPNFDGGKPIPATERPNEDVAQFMEIEVGEGYVPSLAYGSSKSANVLFAVSLAKMLKKHGITVLSLHPGGIVTKLIRTTEAAYVEKMKGKVEWKTLSQGVSTTLVAAFDPKLKDSSGKYLDNCQIAMAMPYVSDENNANRLWKLSEELVGQKFDW